jgi:acyl-CoA thioester hydrolase
LQVLWGDQDSFGHVNNTVFLKWCETGRVLYLERAGMWRMIESQGKGPILVSISCDYRRQVTFPDTVQVGSRVTKIGNSSFRMEHAVVSLAQNAVVAESDSTMVFLEYEHNTPLRVPDDIREAFDRIEGGALRGK